MEIIGRLTAQATVKTTNSGKEFVSFTVAVNEGYKDKKTNEWVNNANFFQCAFWRSTGVTELLTKAAIVHVSGRVGVNVWNNSEGVAQGRLTMNVNQIDIISTDKKGGAKNNTTKKENTNTAATVTSADDLPF